MKINPLDEILVSFAKDFAHEPWQGIGWWGHDTDLGDQKEAFSDAKAALIALIRDEVVGAYEPYEDNPEVYAEVEEMNAAIEGRNQLKAQMNAKLDQWAGEVKTECPECNGKPDDYMHNPSGHVTYDDCSECQLEVCPTCHGQGYVTKEDGK